MSGTMRVVADVSFLRAPEPPRAAAGGRRGVVRSARRRGPYVAGGIVLAVLIALGAGALIVGSSKASLTPDPDAIAKITLPLGGGKIETVSVVTGPHSAAVPVTLQDGRVYPVKLLPAGEKLSLQVVVRRPGWIAWLSGKTQRLDLQVTTPVASLRSHYLTVVGSAPLKLHFKAPVETFSVGTAPAHLTRQVLAHPQTVVTVPRPGGADAGTIFVAATPRTWETSSHSMVNWFPAGGAATAVSNPAPGTRIKPSTQITMTFSKPVSKVLGSHLPPVSPATEGTWHQLNSHTIVFRPEGYGYGLGATVNIALPSGVRLVGGQQGSDASGGSWTVPGGSPLRLQQMLAQLGYLPLNVNYKTPVARTEQAEEASAIEPPAASFSWRYPNTPSWLVGDWSPGAYGEVTTGAVMAFENNEGFNDDGVASPQVWRALINAVIHNQQYTFGYTVADVSEGSPESLDVWHNGHTVYTTAVNTGIPAAPTDTGTFAVYEHVPVTTMSGYNPDGSYYSDPGIPWVSYFNGGDALHGFIRASYGFPQSLGCVEMPYANAAAVYPYTPIGTIVHVT